MQYQTPHACRTGALASKASTVAFAACSPAHDSPSSSPFDTQSDARTRQTTDNFCVKYMCIDRTRCFVAKLTVQSRPQVRPTTSYPEPILSNEKEEKARGQPATQNNRDVKHTNLTIKIYFSFLLLCLLIFVKFLCNPNRGNE